MRIRLVSLIVTLSAALCLTACNKKEEEASKAEPDKAAVAKDDAVKAPVAPEAPKLVKLGKDLAGAEEVAVADLLKDPKAYEGKTVRVAGEVEDFCHHKRAWFGVTAKEGKGMIRVFTMPRFEVPMDCKGKQAVAEGKVEVITIDPEQVEHYGKEHKFLAGVTVKEGEPVLRPIVRAFGAELK
jgi:hypothetical protein